ncbi:MAG: phosphonate ABC transporter ATP-binding protein [Betaproteobacteria bacterium]|nr:MAG: phosphonate ABC transporter ATP-binding protein [Betaproteobacteria bacterium]
MTPAVRIRGLRKTFPNGHVALDGVDLEVLPGEMVAVIGASGSGKSTLLRHVSGLARGDRGVSLIEVGGKIVQSDGRLSRDIRSIRSGIGFVFQQFNLVGRLPVIVNVLTGTLHRASLWRGLVRWFSREEMAAGIEALKRVGIAEFAGRRASTLSGGQQQRAAIARALVQRARVVLADEPIASLDPESSRKVMEILSTINRIDGCTVLVSLHQVNVAMKYCPRTVALHKGRVVYDGPSSSLTPALLRDLYGAEADEILSLPDHISALNDVPENRSLDQHRPRQTAIAAAI